MNCLVRNLVAMGMACAGLMATLASVPAAAADDAVVTADKAVAAALAKGDKVAANKWLDPDFSWIDCRGNHVGQGRCLPRRLEASHCGG